jgi:hypothetical protein
MMLERDMEQLIALFPEEFIESGLKLIGRQGNLGGIRYDLLFEDGNKGKLLVEIQRGTLTRDKVAQILEYYFQLKKIDERPIDLMVIANNISNHKREILEFYGIEYREISERKFREVAEKNNYTFSVTDIESTVSSKNIKPSVSKLESDIQQIEEPPADIDTKGLREQLNNLYSEDKTVVLNARRLLHGLFVQKFKQYSKFHNHVAFFGKTPLWAHERKWAFGANWKKCGATNPLVLLKLPAPPTSAPVTHISFLCVCWQGTHEKLDWLWKSAMPGIENLLKIYPNIRIYDKGIAEKKATISYDKYNTSNITAKKMDDLIQTLACFFDTVDPYLSE